LESTHRVTLTGGAISIERSVTLGCCINNVLK
jgi:hypothetical protein